MSIGENIRRIRNSRKLSIEDIRKVSGLSKSTISELENGKSNPTNETLNKLAEVLEVNITEFYNNTINESNFHKINTKQITLNNKDNFIELIKRDNTNRDDIERIALFYIIAENEDLFEKVNDIYDFEEGGSTPYKALEGEGGYDFCGSSRSLIRIAYNLYNGYPADILGTLYNLDEVNYRIAINGINIRFGRVTLNI
ncbi:MAG: helix-turn-helix transcriptional regulator [Bacilli bacterium]|nr:helix-turn-helix transcriptional regulator [Bacilli bacterium]